MARLAEAVSLEKAQAVAETEVRRGDRGEHVSARVVPLRDDILGSTAIPVLVVASGVAVLLLIAYSNVFGLILADMSSRRREIAIRRALGANSGRILRQFAAEWLVIATVGIVGGLVLARWLLQLVVTASPMSWSLPDRPQLDLVASAVAMVLGVLAAFTFSMLPVWYLRSTSETASLRRGSCTAEAGTRRGHRALVGGQCALTICMVTLASLFGETIVRLGAQSVGFNPAGLLVASTEFTGDKYGGRWRELENLLRVGKMEEFTEQESSIERASNAARTSAIIERISALPGIIGVAGTSAVPFGPNPRRLIVFHTDKDPGRKRRAISNVVTETFFPLMEMPILKGRSFAAVTSEDGQVAIVSQAFERQFLGGEAVGERVISSSGIWTVIGVVPDIRHARIPEDDQPVFYTRRTYDVSHFIVKTAPGWAGGPALLARAIQDASPTTLVARTWSVDAAVTALTSMERFRAVLSAIFGVVALALAGVGLYAVTSRMVRDRTHEFGIRMALGASAGRLRAMVLRDASLTVGVGVAVGLPLAVVVARAAGGLLYGVSPVDPRVLLTSVTAVAVLLFAAVVTPAQRASRVDPLLTLREG